MKFTIKLDTDKEEIMIKELEHSIIPRPEVTYRLTDLFTQTQLVIEKEIGNDI